MAQILIEKRRQIHAGLLVEVRHHILGHDVLIFEMLVEIVDQRPPARIIIDHVAQRVQKSAPLKYMILRRSRRDAALAQ